MPLMEILKSPGVLMVALIFTYIMMVFFAMTAVQPVFWFTPIELGGFAFRPAMISLFQGISGLSQVIWLLIVFPWLLKRYSTGTGGTFLCKSMATILCPAPSMSDCCCGGSLWPSSGFLECSCRSRGVLCSWPFEGMQLCLIDINPRPDTLSTLSAVVYTSINAARAVTPAAFSSLFAIGVGNQILAGYLVWLVLVRDWRSYF